LLKRLSYVRRPPHQGRPPPFWARPGFRHLGAQVTVIEHGPHLAAREDEDVATAIQHLFTQDGIELALNANIAGVDGCSGENVTIRLDDGRTLTGSHRLVAAGRQPMTHDIGLEIAGVELDSRGFIKTDEHLRTSASGVRALGEVMTVVRMAMLGDLKFTALRDGIIAHPTLSEGLNMLFAPIKPA
jgi:NADPH-dependent 2,4-dienoyl-CoA reductase/sulfur reductase-like enzyme